MKARRVELRMSMSYTRLGKSLLLTFTAQGVSILVNFVLNIIVPKFISEYQYANWQTFVLYLSYVGLLHFGLLDGLVLRYSKYDYEELDKPVIRGQFCALLLLTGTCALLLTSGRMLFSNESDRKIAALVAVGIVTRNIFTYNAFAFQFTNRINLYAYLTIAQKLIYGGFTIVLLFLGVDNWIWYCIADLLGDLIGIICCFSYNRDICIGELPSFDIVVKESWKSIASGIKLMIATWSAMFLVGGAKMIVQWHWDKLVFGKVSFAFSMTTLFMTFINAISVVLFPMLKRMNNDELPSLYCKLRKVLSPTLVIIMGLYFPATWILRIWLPKYSESLIYLGILLPTVIYTSKVNLLTNNYLKAYRKESAMLAINVSMIFIALLCYAVSAYILDDLLAVLISAVLIIAIRSIVSEYIITRILNIDICCDVLSESLITIAFIVCSRINNLWVGMIVYFAFVCIYIIESRIREMKNNEQYRRV